MKTTFLSLAFLLIATGLKSQTTIFSQYASSVIDVSSQYGAGPNYYAEKALGAPNVYPTCTFSPEAWTSNTSDGQREFIVLGFSDPQPVNTIRIYQTLAPGAIDTIYLRNSSNGLWTQVYSHTAASVTCASRLDIEIATTPYDVDAIRIALNSPAVPSWNTIDAVSISNFDIMPNSWQQYAATIIGFSSEYFPSPNGYSAAQALGAPTLTLCGNSASAWTSATQDNQREYLVLGYTFPAQANRVTIHQSFNPGAVDTVSVRDASNGVWHIIYIATASTVACPLNLMLEINFTKTTYNVDAVRIAVNSPAVSNFNEIDAVGLQTNLPAGAKFTAQTGNWSNISTWIGGVLPGATDTVIIGNSHNINVDIDPTIKSLFINPLGTLTINTVHALTLGPSGGGKEYAKVEGSILISSGTLAVNGRIEFLTGSSLTMSGGNIKVDGNNGTSEGSIVNGVHLFYLNAGMNTCSVTDGTITIVDPQFNITGQSIVGNYSFGASSTLKLGDGTSTTASNNPNGFGGSNVYPGLGHLIIDAVTSAGNRQFKSSSALTVAGNCTVTSGKFEPTSAVTISGNLINNANISCSALFKINMDVNNNSLITVTAGSFSVLNDFINNVSGQYNVTGASGTSIGDDLVNQGTFTSHWLHMANDFGNSSNEQTIEGSGIFTIYGIQPQNSNVNGIRLLVPITVQELFFPASGGKIFLGSTDLTVNVNSSGMPGINGYVVIDDAGKLITNSITTVIKLFPVGTAASYTPIIIVNGSGHSFSVGVNSTFTFPPNNGHVVNREWNISDLTGGPVSADITFQWNDTDEAEGFNRNLCHVGHFNGSSWNIVSSDSPASGLNPYTRTATGVSSFSPFGVGSDEALPLHLIRFIADQNDLSIVLGWDVENEINFSHFEIERGADVQNFSRIGTLEAKNQPGINTYQFIDFYYGASRYYYRLKMVDFDGSHAYSPIIRVLNDHSPLIMIHPNPTSDYFNIPGSMAFTLIQVVDLQGISDPNDFI